MASENETVAEIREDVYDYLTSIGPSEYPSETQLEEFANRFEAAHKREVAELRNGISELLDALQSIYDEECTSYGTEKVYNKWRKALEGVAE